jgi:hypothetical protein
VDHPFVLARRSAVRVVDVIVQVVPDITGVSSRLILNALCDGERDPEVLADLAKKKLRAKILQLREAVPGRFNEHHAVLLRELFAHIDYLARRVDPPTTATTTRPPARTARTQSHRRTRGRLPRRPPR